MFNTYEEFVDNMRVNKTELIKNNLPKNKKTKKVLVNESDLIKLKNKENYKGPEFYLLNRVIILFFILNLIFI